eukprot:scaffold5919_cov118-Isochrysis_galbana.AAC.3
MRRSRDRRAAGVQTLNVVQPSDAYEPMRCTYASLMLMHAHVVTSVAAWRRGRRKCERDTAHTHTSTGGTARGHPLAKGTRGPGGGTGKSGRAPLGLVLVRRATCHKKLCDLYCLSRAAVMAEMQKKAIRKKVVSHLPQATGLSSIPRLPLPPPPPLPPALLQLHEQLTWG